VEYGNLRNTIIQEEMKMKIQAFERISNVGVALVGEDNTPEDQLTRKIFHYRSKRQLSRQEYLREMSVSFSLSEGSGDSIDWNE
jgi:hypothetical protein